MLIRLENKDIDQASLVLTDAFMEDPLYLAVQPNPLKRKKMIHWLNKHVVKYSIMYGEAYTNQAFDGVCCWIPPGGMELPTIRIIRSGLHLMPLQLGIKAFNRFNQYMSFSATSRKKILSVDYWYLWVIGVSPQNQGTGIGRRLIETNLEKAEKEGYPVLLETENENNLDFYQRFQFHIVETATIPGINVKIWSMIRNPTGLSI